MTRGKPMVGALVRDDASKAMKIVTAYMADASGEYIRFAGDGPTMWRPLHDFEILSMGD
jgi:ribulose bisphosphate carboxylase small subunit